MNEDKNPTLSDVARTARERAPSDFRMQARMLRSAVLMDSRLLLELLGITPEQVEARCLVYLRGRKSEPPQPRQPSASERRAKKAAQAERAIARDIALSSSKSPEEFRRNVARSTSAVRGAIADVRAYVTTFSSLGKEIDFRSLDRRALFEGVRQGSTVARLCDALLKRRAWHDDSKTVGDMYSPQEFAAIRDEVFSDAITPERYGMPELTS